MINEKIIKRLESAGFTFHELPFGNFYIMTAPFDGGTRFCLIPAYQDVKLNNLLFYIIDEKKDLKTFVDIFKKAFAVGDSEEFKHKVFREIEERNEIAKAEKSFWLVDE